MNSRAARHRVAFTPLACAVILLLVFFWSSSPVHGEGHQLVYRQITCRQYLLGDPAIPKGVREDRDHPAATEAESRQGVRWKVGRKGLVEVSHSGSTKIWSPKDGLPILPLTSVAVGPEGWVWMGTPDGAICFRPSEHKGERWFYFWGRRYLEDNTVVNVIAEPHRAWIQTRAGTSLIDFKNYSLEQKSTFFIKRLQGCNDRYGLIASARLTHSGVMSSCEPTSDANNGLWSSLYIAAACFRYAATHSPEALHNAQHSLKGLFRLLWVTGIPGYPARSYVRRGQGVGTGKDWHWAAGKKWKWEGDTSSDELVGHFFAYSIAYDLLPPKDEFYREAIRNGAVNIVNNIREHGWNLTGYGGRVTTWGKFSPAYLKSPAGRDSAMLIALGVLSMLRVAYHVSGNPSFLKDYHRLINQDGYLRYITEGFSKLPPPTYNGYSDEELAFLSFYPLLKYEHNPRLRQPLQKALGELWHHAEAEHNPLWDYIYEVGTGAKNYDAQAALTTLERIPMSTIKWTVNNSQRLDLPVYPYPNADGHKQSMKVIPPDERCTSKWNENPFRLDCKGGGGSADDGTFFLLPYWLGRYHKLVSP